MKLSLPTALLGAALVAVLGATGTAQIREFNLRQMVEYSDGTVIGKVTGKEVIRVDHPIDGPELYYTFLTVQGKSLTTGEAQTVEVVYYGGFVDAENGVFNSEAPSEDDTRNGNRVVVFYKWQDNMGGDVAGNALTAMHGGLYRTYDHKGKVIIQGRGEGYAIDSNVDRSNLETRVREIHGAKQKQQRQGR